ncbi:hypothetical protein LLQ46_22940 [Rouxiella badensis]|uniref:hypothetical protein n=1 Tax=Rouxiella badensis TaxID=1646377 RepID=UPI001B3F45C5|nr:hypothetical protein [Rouxiella badensis]MCC3749718.1 hypothetical protein [Rouxiella badensis]
MNQYQLSAAVRDEVEKLDHRDDDAIYQRTEELDREVKQRNIEAIFQDIRFIDLDPRVMGFTFDSVEFQELATAFARDVAEMFAKYERALVIVSHREAA